MLQHRIAPSALNPGQIRFAQLILFIPYTSVSYRILSQKTSLYSSPWVLTKVPKYAILLSSHKLTNPSEWDVLGGINEQVNRKQEDRPSAHQARQRCPRSLADMPGPDPPGESLVQGPPPLRELTNALFNHRPTRLTTRRPLFFDYKRSKYKNIIYFLILRIFSLYPLLLPVLAAC